MHTCILQLGFRVYSLLLGCSKFLDYGCSFGPGDAVGCVIDRSSSSSSSNSSSSSSGSVSFYLNGQPLGEAFQLPLSLASSPLRPGVCGRGFEVS